MESSQKNHDILEAVNAWLAVAGENLCDRATAELRKRMCASVEAETHRLEETGLSHELALQQAMGQLGDPEVAKLTLEYKHLTKREFIHVGYDFLASPLSPNLVYRKLIPALGIIFLLPVLLLCMVTWGERESSSTVEIVFLLVIVVGIVLLFRVSTGVLPSVDGVKPGGRLSQSVRKQWVPAFCMFSYIAVLQLNDFVDFLNDSEESYQALRLAQWVFMFLGYISILYGSRACKKLAAKIEALENEGFEYVLLPMSRRAVSTPDIR